MEGGGAYGRASRLSFLPLKSAARERASARVALLLLVNGLNEMLLKKAWAK